MSFTHLHLHTEYSILDGAARIDKVIAKAKKLGMTSIAITDHGVMYGVVDFYNAVKKAGLKPIIGCEFYVCSNITERKGMNGEFEHLVLLAKNYKGYLNLAKLSSIAFTEGFYYKPRIDMELLKKYSSDLVCLTACLGGRVPQFLLADQYAQADNALKELKDIFGEDLYVEIQDHGIEEQKITNPLLVKLAKENNLKVIATNDVHYVDQTDAEMHDVLLCMQTGKTLKDEKRMRFTSDQFYFKSEEEMLAVFPNMPESIYNTQEIVEKCNAEIKFNLKLIPNYVPDTGETADNFFERLMNEGLSKRYAVITEEIRERAEYELSIVKKMGFVEYYLIVWDFINYAKTNDIPVGYGRGSGVGSIIAYAIGITNVDPLRFSLLFERFLNPDRVSMPDFDIDFCTERRGEVVEYVINKYGESRVAQIIVFGTLAPRAALKDVARVYDISFADVNKLTKLIPTNPALKANLKKIFRTDFKQQEKQKDFYESSQKKFLTKKADVEKGKTVDGYATKEEFDLAYKTHFENKEEFLKNYVDPKMNVLELIELYENDEIMKTVIDMAIEMEGMPKSTGMHAAGVIICREVISDFVPLSKSKNNVTTQFTMGTCEKIGLLKMDFLGLNTLTDIKKSLNYIKEDFGIEIDFDKMDDTDEGVYELIGSGETDAVFQLESPGMKKFMKDLKPTCMEDIIAGISLYRPGPMDFIPEYIKGKKEPENVRYDHSMLEEILEPSYGVIVYQEQVMQIVQKMAGYSLGQADIIRRAMSKKKVSEMEEHRKFFVEGKAEVITKNGVEAAIDGAKKRGVSKEVALTVFDKMENFAKYAFNKSHAAAYATISYQTAYLKKYYPIQFLCSVLNNRITKLEEVSKYTNYAKEKGYEILPPDINKSYSGFKSENGKIRFGLNGIKNVGEIAVREILKVRDEKPFEDFEDFLVRTNKMTNKRLVESLIKAGAFDCFKLFRSQLMSTFENAMDMISKHEKSKIDGQIDMFDILASEKKYEIKFPSITEYSARMKLLAEKEVAGLYISGHLLDDVRDKLANLFNTSLLIENEQSEEDEEADVSPFLNQDVMMGGIISDISKFITRNGKEMLYGKLEDLYGTIEFICFPRTYDKYKEIISQDGVRVFIDGKISQKNDDSYQLIVQKITEIDQQENKSKEEPAIGTNLYLLIEEENVYERVLGILDTYQGDCTCYVKFQNKAFKHPKKIAITEGLKLELSMCLADECVKII